MRSPLPRFGLPLAAVVVALAAAVAAATVIHPTPEDVAALRGVGDVQVSPDGRAVVYTLATHELDADAEPSEDDTDAGWKNDRQIWWADVATGEARQLTHGDERVGSPRWSPDGRTLAFLRKRDGKPTIHLLPLDGGDAEPLPTGELEPASLGWIAGGTGLVFTAEPPRSEEEKDAKWRTGGTTVWDREWRSAQLWIVPRSGGEARQVTQGTEHVAAWDGSPDGRRFLVLASRSSDPYEESNLLVPQLVDASTGEILRALDETPRACEQPRWSPDGRHVAWLTTEESLSMLNVLRVADVETGRGWDAAPGLELTLASYVWSADGRSLIAAVRERTVTRLLRFPRRGGRPADLGFEARVAEGAITASRDRRRLALLSSTHREPPDPTVFEPGRKKLHVVVRANPQVAEWALGTQERVRWKSPEGPEIEGLLAWPLPSSSAMGPSAAMTVDGAATIGGLAGRTAPAPPLLVLPHGGPDDVTQERWSALVQFFTAYGYAVFRPNYRGGVGYGHAFYAANRGRLGEIEFADIESGVDALVAAGKADPRQLFYGGWSWGGYLAAWTIGHTHRYRAAMVGAGVNDVVVSYALSDINHGVAAAWEFWGDPWREPEHFDRANPMRFVSDATTPTLILHGEEDERVPFVQGVILYSALRDVGCPVEFHAYPREGHGINEPAHVAHRLRTWLDWYERHRAGQGEASR